MDFDLLHPLTWRKLHSVDHLPLAGRSAVRIASDNAHFNKEGRRTIQSLPSWASLAGSCKVCFLEYLHGLILRNRMRHLEAAAWHADLVLKREKQADHIGKRAAAVLARAEDGNDETA